MKPINIQEDLNKAVKDIRENTSPLSRIAIVECAATDYNAIMKATGDAQVSSADALGISAVKVTINNKLEPGLLVGRNEKGEAIGFMDDEGWHLEEGLHNDP